MNVDEVARLLMPRQFQGAKPPPRAGRSRRRRSEPAARILVVEDDYFVALMIEDALLDAGHEVLRVATSGEDAIDAAIESPPDLVLMDIRLAGEMNGIDAAVELRRRGITSIFCSAHSDPAMRKSAAKAQPAGWLIKPFSHAELISAVTAALINIRSS